MVNSTTPSVVQIHGNGRVVSESLTGKVKEGSILFNLIYLKGLTKTKENLCIIGVAADIRTGHEPNNKKRYQSKSVFSYPTTNDRTVYSYFEIHNLRIYEHPVLCRTY